ncbi:MAG TPA: peptidoglycan-binding protein [Myxococcaceae bacterium]|nr:peptidoglycan-binding protein [Myxococcaceae bacterium]
MQSGSNGSEVSGLQDKLKNAGYDAGTSGKFDAKTEAAVRQYQKDNNLKVDGKVGQQTWGNLIGQKGLPPGTNMLGQKARNPDPTGRFKDTFEPAGQGRPGASARPPAASTRPAGAGGNQQSPAPSQKPGAPAAKPAGQAQAPSAPAGAPQGKGFTAKGTGYFPDNSAMEGGFKDRKGAPLHTLQDFLAGKSKYVSVAMDSKAFPYGTKLRIPELEAKYGRPIEFRVVDTGGAFRGRGTSRIDICTANRRASLDPTVNGKLTLIPQR